MAMQLSGAVDPWIERSWQRCLAQGRRPDESLGFDAVSREAMQRAVEASRPLVNAARPILGQLAHAMAHTRYFAILTNAQGIVVDASGPIDRKDRRAINITRIGVDLSERAVGTTAIGAALGERQPVWLHRGEHFFDANTPYSCAGAPLFGPSGECVGMLDLTGIDAPERPELKHLVTQCAQRIENALLHQENFALLVRLSWPNDPLWAWGQGDLNAPEPRTQAHTSANESDGLICLDGDGYVVGSNTTARQMLPMIALETTPPAAHSPIHSSDLFAMPWENLFDAAMLGQSALEVPLWSGLRLHAWPQFAKTADAPPAPRRATGQSLRDVETSLIRKAVAQANGNVTEAARALGISRATVYRKLGH
jgi:sigma-54 dependent transcriptional regulator, acetoin dehydrogenase operon transcriptional activator AcoR